jgi:hypothetical protein
MSFTGKFLGIATLSLAFSASAGAQAPQVEKNVARAVHKRWPPTGPLAGGVAENRRVVEVECEKSVEVLGMSAAACGHSSI